LRSSTKEERTYGRKKCAGYEEGETGIILEKVINFIESPEFILHEQEASVQEKKNKRGGSAEVPVG